MGFHDNANFISVYTLLVISSTIFCHVPTIWHLCNDINFHLNFQILYNLINRFNSILIEFFIPNVSYASRAHHYVIIATHLSSSTNHTVYNMYNVDDTALANLLIMYFNCFKFIPSILLEMTGTKLIWL